MSSNTSRIPEYQPLRNKEIPAINDLIHGKRRNLTLSHTAFLRANRNTLSHEELQQE